MINSVPVLLLGIVIMSVIGSVLGYLLEPGRFAERDAAVAADLSGAQPQAQTGNHSPRLAA